MNRVGWWLVDIASRMLAPPERDVALGDLAESGEGAGAALSGVLGLVARRQASLWKDWHPWLGLVGLALPLGYLLTYMAHRLESGSDLYLWIIRNYATIDPSILEQTGLTLRQGIPPLICGALLLFLWSWICGFVLGLLSRQTIWINGTVFCLVPLCLAGLVALVDRRYPYSIGAVLPLAFYTVVLPVLTPAVLVLVPSTWGMWRSRRGAALSLPGMALLAAVVVAALVVQNAFWKPPRTLQLEILAGWWPMGYMTATVISQHRPHWKKEKTA